MTESFEYQPEASCPCGDQGRPGHPVGWCRQQPRHACGLGLCGTVTECPDCGRAPGKAPECSYVGRCNSSRCPVHGQPAAPIRAETEPPKEESVSSVAPTEETLLSARYAVGEAREILETVERGMLGDSPFRRRVQRFMAATNRTELARRGLK
jgi:hypothetical protein